MESNQVDNKRPRLFSHQINALINAKPTFDEF